MKNPVAEIRKEKELNLTEFAKLAGIGFTTLQNIEKGRTININEKLLDLLEKMGYDKQKIKVDYENYKDKEQEELLNKVM